MSTVKIKGQELATGVLKEQVKNNTLPQSYIFSGKEGIGKKLTALQLASQINCQYYPDYHCIDKGGICLSCSKIKNGIHPDVKEVSPDGNFIKGEQIKELIQTSGFKAFESNTRVYIIDAAHKMNASSANAMLKTLEEPPSDSVFILISSAPNAILPTITSRCQTLKFKELSTDVITEILVREKGISSQRASILASYSQGSVGAALSIDHDDFFEYREAIFLGIKAILDRDEESVINKAEQFSADKNKVLWTLELILSCFRDLSVYSTSGNKHLLIHKDKKEYFDSIVKKKWKVKPWSFFFMVVKAIEDLERNCNVRLSLEALFLEMSELCY